MASPETIPAANGRMSPTSKNRAFDWFQPMGRPARRIVLWMSHSDMLCLAVLLLVRALFRPYVGLVHDAKLYALQVANRASDGWFANDLFFAFGSQDNYSLVSWILSPIAGAIGVRATFLLAYLLFMACLLYAEIRLIRVLFGRSWQGVLALLCVAAFDHPYGGRDVFHIHEPFFTARLPAQALLLWAVTLLWQCPKKSIVQDYQEAPWHQTLAALGLCFLAVLIHPLMGIGGLAVASGIVLARIVPKQGLMVAVSAGLLLLGLVSWNTWETWLPSLERITGDWETSTRIVSPHCYITEWFAEDFIQALVIIALLVGGAFYCSGASRALLIWSAFLAVGSLIVSNLADHSRIAILVAGQAYRGLWLPTLLAIPAAFIILTQFWKTRSSLLRHGALLLSAVLLVRTACIPEWPAAIILYVVELLGVTVVTTHVSRLQRARSRRVIAELVALGPGFSLVLLFIIAASLTNLWNTAAMFAALNLDPATATWLSFRFVSPLVLGLGSVSVAAWIARHSGKIGLLVTSLLVWFAMNASFAGVLNYPPYRDRFYPALQSLDFVRSQFDSSSSRTPTVYWPFQSVNIWMDLKANCYHEFTQVSGVVFSQRMAAESRRRTQLLTSIEIAAMPYHISVPDYWQCVLNYMEVTWDQPQPTAADIRRLAGEPNLDWIVLPFPTEGISSKTDGHVYVYDCRQLRESMGGAHGSSASDGVHCRTSVAVLTNSTTKQGWPNTQALQVGESIQVAQSFWIP